MGYSFAAVSVRRNPRWVVTRALRRRSARSVAVGLLALTGVYLCFSLCNYAIWSRRERLSVKPFLRNSKSCFQYHRSNIRFQRSRVQRTRRGGMDQLRQTSRGDRSRTPGSLARLPMEEGQWRNQKMVKDAWSLGANVSLRSSFVGRLLGSETIVSPKALRILRVIVPEESEKKGVMQGPRVEASRNFWEGSGLKIDSSSTDVVWGHGSEFVLR